ncbi:MAG: beta-ketoacyl-ACP synthase [Betaproteobacteria bacterium]
MKPRPLVVVAATLTNACGVGWNPVRATLHRGETALRPFDLEWAPPLTTWIGRVAGLESTSMPDGFASIDSRSNRLAHLCLEQDGFRAAVADAVERHGRGRVGLFIGTTTSGVLSTELAWRGSPGACADATARPPPVIARDVHNMHATTRFIRRRLDLGGPVQTISTACSSSAKAFAAAARFIAAGLCDAAVVGGVESLALSTLFGFKALDLVSPSASRPLATDRDGISIGEGAGFALLEGGGEGPVRLLGCGESSDGWHMSTPHPEGVGAARAMRAALAAAGIGAADVDYVNLHGTASRANDAAEDRAVTAVLGTHTPVSSTKGCTGHTLGAAGITEALISVLALADQWIPGTVNCDVVDPTLEADVVLESRAQPMAVAMSNSFGFGGSNCTLVFGVSP